MEGKKLALSWAGSKGWRAPGGPQCRAPGFLPIDALLCKLAALPPLKGGACIYILRRNALDKTAPVLWVRGPSRCAHLAWRTEPRLKTDTIATITDTCLNSITQVLLKQYQHSLKRPSRSARRARTMPAFLGRCTCTL